jgi:hypothetical protein
MKSSGLVTANAILTEILGDAVIQRTSGYIVQGVTLKDAFFVWRRCVVETDTGNKWDRCFVVKWDSEIRFG